MLKHKQQQQEQNYCTPNHSTGIWGAQIEEEGYHKNIFHFQKWCDISFILVDLSQIFLQHTNRKRRYDERPDWNVCGCRKGFLRNLPS